MLEWDPGYVFARCWLSADAYRQGERAEAETHLGAIQGMAPPRMARWIARVRDQEGAGKADEAMRTWGRALAVAAKPGAAAAAIDEAAAPLAFIHLPRTAGNSLAQAIQAAYGGRAGRVHASDDVPEPMLARLAPDVAIIHGHMNHGIHRRIPVRYATVLREPIERCLSHFGLFRVQQQAQGRTVGFDEFLRRKYASNLQCGMLSGLFRRGPLQAGPALDLARAHLESFHVVGFFDRLDEFAHRLGLQTPLPHMNSYRSEFEPTAEQLEELRRINSADLQLYDWARKHFAGPSVVGQ